eukprot:350975-Chlamydomonas_euryale.AAC.9
MSAPSTVGCAGGRDAAASSRCVTPRPFACQEHHGRGPLRTPRKTRRWETRGGAGGRATLVYSRPTTSCPWLTSKAPTRPPAVHRVVRRRRGRRGGGSSASRREPRPCVASDEPSGGVQAAFPPGPADAPPSPGLPARPQQPRTLQARA